MSRALATFDRLLVFIIAAALIAVGVWCVGLHFDVPLAERMKGYADRDVWTGLSHQSWYWGAVVGVCVLSALLGLWLIGANLRRRRFSVVNSDSSNEFGDINYNLSAIAAAAADALEATNGVDHVRKRLVVDRGRPTMQFTLDVDHDCSMPGVKNAIEQVEHDIRDAIEGYDVATSYKVHLDRVPQNHSI